MLIKIHRFDYDEQLFYKKDILNCHQKYIVLLMFDALMFDNKITLEYIVLMMFYEIKVFWKHFE
jgi:hypothetical protein